MVKRKVQKPDYRNNGQYQFVTGWTGGGAEECVHLSRGEIATRLTRDHGAGYLEDDSVDLWWCQEDGTRQLFEDECI